MKNLLITMFCLGLATPLLADGTSPLTDEKSRVSYAIGLNIGHNFKQQGLDSTVVDADTMSRAIKDVLAGNNEMMTEAEAKDVLRTFQTEIRTKMVAQNKTEGAAFLATNKMTPGVKEMSVALPDGKASVMQYLVETTGTGPIPQATDEVSVNYRGTLLNGTEFDSSYKRHTPATFGVGGVIKGWTEALKMMPVGSKWKLFIPADLAYGENGRPGIPPNALLIFEVELLNIKSTAAGSPGASLSSDIIKVPSAAEMNKGAKIEVIKQEDVQKAQQEAQQQSQSK